MYILLIEMIFGLKMTPELSKSSLFNFIIIENSVLLNKSSINLIGKESSGSGEASDLKNEQNL